MYQLDPTATNKEMGAKAKTSFRKSNGCQIFKQVYWSNSHHIW